MIIPDWHLISKPPHRKRPHRREWKAATPPMAVGNRFPCPVLRVFLFGTMLVFVSGVCGCAPKRMTELHGKPPQDPLEAMFVSDSVVPHKNPDRYSDRVELTLRAYDWEKRLRSDPVKTLVEMRRRIECEATPELLCAFAEIAYFQGKNLEKENPQLATEIYYAALRHAYRYLFDPQFQRQRNYHDTQLRSICLIYNHSLTQILRLMGGEYDLELQPNQIYEIRTGNDSLRLACRMHLEDWHGEQVERYKFCADYLIKGLQNEYRQSGLGVPLIAVRKPTLTGAPEEKYYPPDLCFPVTAFLRPIDGRFAADSRGTSSATDDTAHFGAFDANFNPLFAREFDKENENATVHAVLEFHDTLVTTHIDVLGQSVPLESDLTTPLAYFLSNPAFNIMGVVGLLRPDELFKARFLPETGRQIAREQSAYRQRKRSENQAKKHPENPSINAAFRGNDSRTPSVENVENTEHAKNAEKTAVETIRGIYMMQPYDPEKIPVVMIHGLGSSPMTWMEMFNNLRSNEEIRRHYQFWFYYYPSAQPFWVSAAQLRDDLAEIRNTLNPGENAPGLKHLVLVGHSMGGLISRLQVIDSGEEVWKLVSKRPFSEIHASEQSKAEMRKWFFFQADESIDRVVTIATPFHGSDFANNLTQWLAHRTIRLPQTITGVLQEYTVREDAQLDDDSLLKMKTSVDSLSPKNPLFSMMGAHPPTPDVSSHNILGVQQWSGCLRYFNAEGDGVVKSTSAHLPDARSEITVPSSHSYVHTHPRAIMEVRRILLEHLQEKESRHVPVWHETKIPDFVPELSPPENAPLKERPGIWED